MGAYANRLPMIILSAALAVVILGLNMFVLVQAL